MLKPFYQNKLIEAGCDEAGRGCLAGPVFAAAVILPKKFSHPLLNDSKQVSEKNRNELRKIIEDKALAFAVASIDNNKIDEINILRASFKAVHLAIRSVATKTTTAVNGWQPFYPLQKNSPPLYYKRRWYLYVNCGCKYFSKNLPG